MNNFIYAHHIYASNLSNHFGGPISRKLSSVTSRKLLSENEYYKSVASSTEQRQERAFFQVGKDSAETTLTTMKHPA
jgi:hypothetical protein